MEFLHYNMVTGSFQRRRISTLSMQNLSFMDHVLLVKQQNMVIGLRKMLKPFKDIKLSNQMTDIMMIETMLHIKLA